MMINTFQAKPIRFFYQAIGLSVIILIVNFIFIYCVNDSNQRIIFSDILPTIVNLLATIALFLAAKQTYHSSKTSARAWIFLAIAQLIYTFADTIWAVLEIGFSQTPFPSIADIFYVSYYPLFLLGVLFLPTQQRNMEKWYASALDMGIILIAALLLYWNYILGPTALSNSHASFWTQVLSLAYPVGDLVMLGALLLLLFRPFSHANGMSVSLITISAISMFLTDSAFSIQSLAGTYTSGSLIDIGWIFSNLTIGLAGVWQVTMTHQQQKDQPSLITSAFESLNHQSSFLSNLGLLAALWLLFQSTYASLPMSKEMVTIGVIILVLFVIVRHIVTRIENKRLFKLLDAALKQTQQQALDLEFEISERKRIERQLLYDTSHDGLTGLPNRVLLLDRLGQAIEQTPNSSRQLFSTLFLDIDNFSHINDSLGHSAGDQLLILISQRLKKCLKHGDMLIRLGGDEFIVLLESIENDRAALAAAHNILEELKAPFNLYNQNIFITTSIGIVLNQEGYQNPFDILRDADIALGQAKLNGQSSVEVFKSSLRNKAIERQVMGNDLRHAIEYQEFMLYYQPIVSLTTNEIISFEALIRWQNPVRGLVMPDSFIPIAEETGLIVEIGKWVLNEACQQLKKWQEQFLHAQNLSIHVNISGIQLKHAGFLNDIKQILQKTGLNPDCLKLEITESIFVENQEMTLNIYSALRELGVHLQIDDFGTGYSSLSYLQHIPVDIIKIDRSFISGIGKKEKAVELIRAMISMSNSLDTRTIAEGIETIEELSILRELNCDFGQGFLFSRPLDKKSIGKMIKNGLFLT